jgi:4-deoxy-L-threo-5-hexosulose-uronate ketol-isomerase
MIMKMTVRNPSHPQDAKHYTTDRLRSEFVIETIFAPDEATLVYSHFDRIIAGGILPVTKPVELTGSKELAAETFLERRELGVINVGGRGNVTVDGTVYEMNARDGLYVGMGAKSLSFESADGNNPARFYINSCPAHKTYPNKKIDITQANPRPLGSAEACNKRTIYQYLHPAVMPTCQLCMGLTALEPGSNWNSMPCHTHERRMEVYFYFDMKPGQVVFHMMGEPKETRHVILHNEQAVISPSWSIHTGVGTSNYTFIWGLCGENQAFDDMDNLQPGELL